MWTTNAQRYSSVSILLLKGSTLSRVGYTTACAAVRLMGTSKTLFLESMNLKINGLQAQWLQKLGY